jgi:UDP:flavonoid glycosyltransferase YjiC (YdhE family)
MMPKSLDNQKKVIQLMTEAAKLAGCRAIIQSSISGLAEEYPNEDIFFIDRAPHSLIFPFCSAVVHHGGAGTTHSALAAGCPSIVVAHVSDQTFWGKELTRLGVAPKILHQCSLTAEKLAERIRTTLNSRSMRQKAQILGQSIRKEDGLGLAVQLIEQRFSRPAQVLTGDRAPG